MENCQTGPHQLAEPEGTSRAIVHRAMDAIWGGDGDMEYHQGLSRRRESQEPVPHLSRTNGEAMCGTDGSNLRLETS